MARTKKKVEVLTRDMLTPQERECHISMSADDHSTWHVYTDDDYWIRRLDKVIPGVVSGIGKKYEIPAKQITIRKERKKRVSKASVKRAVNV